MQDPEGRDTVTLDIATGLALFALVVLLGGGLMLVLNAVVGLAEPWQTALLYTVVGGAAVLMLLYLYRRRSR